MEAKGEPGKALEFYDQILKEDEADMVCRSYKSGRRSLLNALFTSRSSPRGE